MDIPICNDAMARNRPSLIRRAPIRNTVRNTQQQPQGPDRWTYLPTEVQSNIIDFFDNPIDATNFMAVNKYTYQLIKNRGSVFQCPSTVASRVVHTTEPHRDLKTQQRLWLDNCFCMLPVRLRMALFKDPSRVKPFPLIGCDIGEIGEAWLRTDSMIRAATSQTTVVLSKPWLPITHIQDSLDDAITHSIVFGGSARTIKAAGRIVDRFIDKAVNLFESPEFEIFNFACNCLNNALEIAKTFEVEMSQKQRAKMQKVIVNPVNALTCFDYVSTNECLLGRCSPYDFLVRLSNFHFITQRLGYEAPNNREKEQLKYALRCAFFDPKLDRSSCAWLLTNTLIAILASLEFDFDPFALKQIVALYKNSPKHDRTTHMENATSAIEKATLIVKSICRKKAETSYNQFFDLGINKFNERSDQPQAYRDHFRPSPHTFHYLILHDTDAPKDVEEMLNNPQSMINFFKEQESLRKIATNLADALFS